MDPIVAAILTLIGGGLAGSLVNIYYSERRRREDAMIREQQRAEDVKRRMEQRSSRRLDILSMLKRYAETLPRISKHNATAAESESPHVAPMPYPTEPFQIAIFAEDGISVTADTTAAVTEYLLKADELNGLVQIVMNTHLDSDSARANDRKVIKQFIAAQGNQSSNDNIGFAIDKLKECIAYELAQA
jgi:hypothetical protein